MFLCMEGDGAKDSMKSSLTILANSLTPYQTYYLMVITGKRVNAILQVTGFF